MSKRAMDSNLRPFPWFVTYEVVSLALIAAPIAFLMSEDASFINGAILPVDGGVMASNGQPNFAG